MERQELNKGALVKIRDYSYALRLGTDKVSNKGSCEPNARQTFKVLVVDCNMPTYMLGDLQRYADTIVMGQDDNIVWLVHSGLVQLVNPPEIKLRYFSSGKDITNKLSRISKQVVRLAAD